MLYFIVTAQGLYINFRIHSRLLVLNEKKGESFLKDLRFKYKLWFGGLFNNSLKEGLCGAAKKR